MSDTSRKPVSETIASGFSANRRARGSAFKALSVELASIAIGYQGIEVYCYNYDQSARQKRAEVRVVKTNQVGKKSAQLGHLNRSEVYEAIEEIPYLGSGLDVSVDEIKPEKDSLTPAGVRLIVVEFDAGSGERLSDEHGAIGSKLAELAGLSPEELDWPLHYPDLALAQIESNAPRASQTAYASMRETVTDSIAASGTLDFHLNPIRLLPRLDAISPD